VREALARRPCGWGEKPVSHLFALVRAGGTDHTPMCGSMGGVFRNGLNPIDLIALVVVLAVVVGLVAGVTLLVRAVWRSGSKRQNP